MQSNINDTFKETKQILSEGKIVFYTGTPCQIEGVKSFLRKDYLNLYTADLICHGVPSKNIFDEYIQKFKEPVEKIYFRKKERINIKF